MNRPRREQSTSGLAREIENTMLLGEEDRRALKVDEFRFVLKEQIPDYPFGGKRMLISDDYFPALNRENVEVVLSPIDHVTENAIVAKDGRAVPM